MGFQTDCATTGEDRRQYHGSVAPPIYASSLFTFERYEDFQAAFRGIEGGGDEAPVYSRGSNPTVRVLERKIAVLEGGEDARMFGSGMAAIGAAILSTARAGDHIVAVRSIYSNVYRLLHGYLPTLGVETTFVDFTDLDAVEAAIRPTTRALYLESPGNPTMDIVDLAATADLARRHSLTTIMDNTLATPFNQRPLAWGIDLVVHSVSKYLGGHSDVVAGAVVGSAERMRRISAFEIRDLGGILPPFEAWLVLRGIRTLGIRMQAHNSAGLRVAEWLERHPRVQRVFYPGLASHPQAGLLRKQMTGYSGLLAAVVDGGMDGAIAFADGLRLFGIGVSWGGFESLVLPLNPEKTEDPSTAAALGIVPGFVRLSIGLEDVDDLICDLDAALKGLP